MKVDRTPFGRELQRWRVTRGLSQLRLATEAAMSPRYLSFVETGRSRPSAAIVQKLADALDVPLRERNQLFVAAGLAPAYRERGLDDTDLAGLRQVIETMLRKHEPYPAFALDGAYRVVRANEAARRMVPDVERADWIDMFFAPESPLRSTIENFAEVAWSSLELLRRDHGATDAAARLAKHLGDLPRPASVAESPVLTATFRFGDRRVRTITTVARFGATRDITVDELRVELVFPADDESHRFFEELAR